MATLINYSDLNEKRKCFSNENFYIIDSVSDFDRWFEQYHQDNKPGERINYIYRGMNDARYRLYTSAQRQWITNDMKEWGSNGFLEYIQKLIDEAKTNVLIKKVFDLYDYDDRQREIPILSILQHYGAPTPLMDWTYNINVALFFATEDVKSGCGTGNIENYFSIYFVNKSKYEDSFINLFKVQNKKHPSINKIKQQQDESEADIVYYISDFEIGTYNANQRDFKINARLPLTSIYNQNIIPQEGLFIFNPFPEKSLDEFFGRGGIRNGDGTFSQPFACFNIKKDLADYVRRRIKNRVEIDKEFIYPNLNTQAKLIHEYTLNKLAP